jgi:tetraacyldisaccharide 4'-kinase
MSIEDHWYRRDHVSLSLWPVSQFFRGVAAVRRGGLRIKNLFGRKLPVPVIIVGNIMVGGTGKTPMVIWLVKFLQEHGYKPGVVSRGYGGTSEHYPLAISPVTSPEQGGDEPVLIARRTGAPVYIDPKRPRAARALLKDHPEVDIIISDDGLQHYALQRDMEIVMIDSRRGLGNGFLIPAGPLREPASRLKHCDFVVVNGPSQDAEYRMGLQAGELKPVRGGTETSGMDAFRHQDVHAVAGIGHPDRFFDTLRAHGIQIIEHAFPDHYQYRPEDLRFGDDLPVIMTEKDAVKCQSFAPEQSWFLPVTAVPDRSFAEQLLKRLRNTHAG